MGNDKAIAMMQQIWIKAYKDGEITLPLKTKADAVRTRFMLYNVAKSVKNGPKGLNMDLESAVEECMINVLSDTTLVVRHKALSPLLQDLGAIIGVNPEAVEVISEEAIMARESADRLMKRLAEDEKNKLTEEDQQILAKKMHNPYADLLDRHKKESK